MSAEAMPPPPTMVTGCPARAVTRVASHDEARADVATECRPASAEGQGVLGDERGMRTLAARPDAAVGHEPGVEKALDPGPGEVHPADGGELLEHRAEATGPRPVHPHEALGVLDGHDPTPGRAPRRRRPAASPGRRRSRGSAPLTGRSLRRRTRATSAPRGRAGRRRLRPRRPRGP